MRKLKVFHGMKNYGTQAGLLAKGLRDKGIDAISVTYPDMFHRQTDIELMHGGNFLIRILKHSWNWFRRVTFFFRYNTFHFYYGSSLLPGQIDLPFYRLFGKKVVMHYLGSEIQSYRKSVEKYKWTNMLAFKDQHHKKLNADKIIEKRYAFEKKYVDLQLVCNPLLYEFVPDSIIIPLAIDLNQFRFTPKFKSDTADTETVIMHAPTSRGYKGTNYIIETIQILKKEGYRIRLCLVENVAHHELKELYKQCDIFIDQVLSGWYGTASIEAMATGRPVVCFIREEYFQYIDYGNQIPIISANPDTLLETLKYMIDNRQTLTENGRKCREFVENYHDLNAVTDMIIQLYNRMNNLEQH